MLARWASRCESDASIADDSLPPGAGDLIDAIAAALDRPQPIDLGPDTGLESSAQVFAQQSRSLAVATVQIMHLADVIAEDIPATEDAIEVHTRLRIASSWALRAAARHVAAELAEHAHRDSLTGLLNRRAYDREAAQEDARLRQGARIVLIFADLDYLKAINDRSDDGHSAGDEALRALAQALTRARRDNDVVYRWGGDEFVVVRRDPADGAVDFVDRVRQSRPPSFTVGVADSGEDGTTLTELHRVADTRLIEAKAAREGG